MAADPITRRAIAFNREVAFGSFQLDRKSVFNFTTYAHNKAFLDHIPISQPEWLTLPLRNNYKKKSIWKDRFFLLFDVDDWLRYATKLDLRHFGKSCAYQNPIVLYKHRLVAASEVTKCKESIIFEHLLIPLSQPTTALKPQAWFGPKLIEKVYYSSLKKYSLGKNYRCKTFSIKIEITSHHQPKSAHSPNLFLAYLKIVPLKQAVPNHW